MSEQENYKRLGQLAEEQLKHTRESRRQFILRIGASENTVADFIKGKRIPTTGTLRAVVDGLGWDWAKVNTALALADPTQIELTDLRPDPWGAADGTPTSLLETSDEALMVELTRRLAERNATISQLRATIERGEQQPVEVADAPTLPPNVFDLAADQDRSGHGRALRDAIDRAGEESQDY